MAVFKCKMCGGDLEINGSETVVKCEYCGSVQTVPQQDDEKKLIQFERAERLRKQCEFDKAAGIYESIVADFRQESEAYWGLVLCKYGIEYVDDPATGKKVPTCHRSSFESIFDDSNFEQALENADVVAKKVYREEAKVIEKLRKAIIEVSSKEEPYDIFICYKETDENGERTVDSVIAQDVYTELTAKGYRVFFSRITLEDKLGQEYEPYIFAALNSAVVMLAFGTDYEYYNAVWVKNEWSRFLQLIAKGEKKTLIPCYKNIDAYDMPKEFARLQAQDMGKVGAIQDLLRGIEKIIPKKASAATVMQDDVVLGDNRIAARLRRAHMALEEGDWVAADEYCERVLDFDPECAEAYFGKLLAELRCRNPEELKNRKEPFDHYNNYQKALRFADDKLKRTLVGYIAFINERNETARKDAVYVRTKNVMQQAKSKSEFMGLARQFDAVSDYKDAEMLAKVCREKAEEIRIAEEKHLAEVRRKAKAKKKALCIIAVSVAVIVTVAVVLTMFINLNSNYSNAVQLMNDGRYSEAAVLFGSLDNYKDARENSISLWNTVAVRETVSAGRYTTVGLHSDGTAVAVGSNNFGQREVDSLSDMVAISAGYTHTVGLKADGTVVAVGSNTYGQCDVSGWQNIVAISAGTSHTVGLKSDGTVVAVGDNANRQCNVPLWSNIVAISAGNAHTVGLKADGTVVAIGADAGGQCNVTAWQNIVAISAGTTHTVGLKADGTVVAVGDSEYGRCNVSEWTDITAIATGRNHTVGLKSDGTVVAVGENKSGVCDVTGWTDIVAICAGSNHTVGLKSDGTVVSVGKNDKHQCDVTDWTDIKLPE